MIFVKKGNCDSTEQAIANGKKLRDMPDATAEKRVATEGKKMF